MYVLAALLMISLALYGLRPELKRVRSRHQLQRQLRRRNKKHYPGA